MSLPSLSDQDRADALKKAAAARQVRSETKTKLRSGALSVSDVIDASATDAALSRLKVSDLLEALPGIGKVRAALIMDELGIAATRRVRGLGIHQRSSLIDYLERVK